MTKPLDHTIAGIPLHEWPRVAAETVAPQLMLRVSSGYTMDEYLPMALEQGDAGGPYAWTLLSELMDRRPSIEQLYTAIVDTGIGMATIKAALAPGLAEADELQPRRSKRVRRLLDLVDDRLTQTHPGLASNDPKATR